MVIDKKLSNISRYYVYLLNIENKKIKFIDHKNNKKELFLKVKEKVINKKDIENYNIVLLKIKKVVFNKNQPIKMVFGPVKVEIDFFEFTKRKAITSNKNEKRNNHLFYTEEYLQDNKISKKDLLKIVDLAVNGKLEKRFLAPKTINQIIKK